MTIRRASGFTLIELMTVVAVVAVLAAIALPSYQSQMRKTRRAVAISTLQDLQLRQEKWRVDHSSYAIQSQLGTITNPNQYTINVTISGSNSYYLSAVPTGSQAGDTCGALTLASVSGVITKTAAGAVNPSCW
jgi:type IV pilus assembly protein PilE